MAFVIDSQLAGTDTAFRGDPISIAFVNTAGTVMYAWCVATDQTGTVTLNAPTYNGVAGTLIGSQGSYDTAHTKFGWYRWTSPATGSNTFGLTGAGGSGNFRVLAIPITFSGNDATTFNGTPVAATGTSATAATGNIANTAGSIIIAGCCDGANRPIQAGGATLSSNLSGSGNTGGDNIGLEYFAATGVAKNMQMTFTSDVWGISGLEILAAAGAPDTLWAQGLM